MSVEQENIKFEQKVFSASYIAKKALRIGLVLSALYLLSLRDYLIFHSFVELAGAAIAIAIFLLAWNSRKFTNNSVYVFIGAMFLASGILNILHAMAYKGMTVFPGTLNDANLGTQLWLANQYVLAGGLFATSFLFRKKTPKIPVIISIFSAYLAIVLLSIFWWQNFPMAYIEGTGLTAFKKISEYFVVAIYLLSAYFFVRGKNKFDSRIANIFSLVAILLAFSTILFTLYVGVYSFFNLWGHLIRLAAMYPIYIGIVEFGLMKPYDFLFGNLKAREKLLEKNEKMFKAVVDDQTELICRFRPDGTLTFVNGAYCRYYGKAREALIGKPYFELVPDDVSEKDKIHLLELNRSNPVGQYEHRAIDKNGWHRWQNWTTRAIFGEGDELIEYQSIGRDITQQKYVQKALVKSEKNYRTLVDNSLVGIYKLDKDGNYTYVNEAMAKMFGFSSPEEMIRENVRSRYKDLNERQLFLKLIKEKGKMGNYEAEGAKKNGKKIVVLASVTMNESGISGIVTDITERRRAEKALKKAVEEWDITFNSISDPIFILDIDHTIIKANQALLEFLGKSEKEIIGKKCYEVVHKQHRAWPTCPLSITKKSGQSHTEEVADPALGKVLLVTTSPIKNSHGDIVGIAHIAKDITERKRTEKKIANLAKFPEENPNPVLRVNAHGKIIYSNPASRILLTHWKARVGGLAPEKWINYVNKALESGKKLDVLEEFDEKIFSIMVAPISKGEYVNLYGRDITQVKKLERVKDEFISLASHQLRTPLSSIALSAELMLRGTAGNVEPGQKEYLEEIYKATKRMTLLVNNLLNVSRVEMGNFEIQPGPFDIATAVHGVVREFLPLISDKKLHLEMNIGKDIPFVNLDEKSFGIIFENLLSNSIRYTAAKGKIVIELEKITLGILLKISDTGLGIPASHQRRIFQKSFRAANAREISSEGAGLGLYMAKIAADKSGAKIRFESKEGKGTTFFVNFSSYLK